MQELIALLAPALMALGFYNHLTRNKLSNKKLLFAYGTFVVLINLVSFLFTIFILGQEIIYLGNRAFVGYLIVASIFSIIMPFVVNLVEQMVAIEVKKND